MTFELLQNPMRWIFFIHIVGGITALSIFLIPLLTNKGGKLHIRAGWSYVVAMSVVAATTYMITPWRAFFDPMRSPSSVAQAAFLFFIATFALSSLWYGLVALKNRQRIIASHSILHIGPPIILIILSVAVQIMGIYLRNILLIVFPFLGLFSGKIQLDYWRTAPIEKMHWWYAHMSGMFIACIATVTAFLVTALPRLWPGPISESFMLWIAPGLIMGKILSLWTTSYRTKFGEPVFKQKT